MEDSVFIDLFQTDPFEFSLEDFDFQSIPCYQESLNIINTPKIEQNPQSSSFHNYPPNESCTNSIPRPSSQLISFGCSNPPSPGTESLKLSSVTDVDRYGWLPETGGRNKRKGCPGTRSPVLAKEHVLAERKRRETLNERFIALSALLPGLKKADKASILQDAVRHLKKLQERVRTLETQQDQNKNRESLIYIKKSHIIMDDDSSSSPTSSMSTTSSNSSEENSGGVTRRSHQALPEIEARVSKNEVLIRIQCEKNKGSMVNILSRIEKLGLSVVNSIVLPFGDSILDISVLAKMEDVSVPVKDIAKNLRLAMLRYS